MMKSPRSGPTYPSETAFSLVELLVVVAVLGILAALAIPAISNTIRSSDYSKNLRNAQMLSGVSQAAVAAGHPGTNTVDSWISLLTNGLAVTNVQGGNLAYFRVDALSTDDVTGASTYLAVENAKLIYRPSP